MVKYARSSDLCSMCLLRNTKDADQGKIVLNQFNGIPPQIRDAVIYFGMNLTSKHYYKNMIRTALKL